MSLRIVIPVRPVAEGKKRLVPALTQRQREALNFRLFSHALHVSAAAAGASACAVVSRSPELLSYASDLGAEPIEEEGNGLNAALEQAAAFAACQGATSILSLSCDLPLLKTDDLRELLSLRADRSAAIATDRMARGTNALLLSPPQSIPYRYGEDSLDAHRSGAEAAGLNVAIVNRIGLGFDLDTPEDLALLRAEHDWELPL